MYARSVGCGFVSNVFFLGGEKLWKNLIGIALCDSHFDSFRLFWSLAAILKNMIQLEKLIGHYVHIMMLIIAHLSNQHHFNN